MLTSPPLPPRPQTLDVFSAKDIVAAMPEHMRGQVSPEWVTRNVPGKFKVGKRFAWAGADVRAYFTRSRTDVMQIHSPAGYDPR